MRKLFLTVFLCSAFYSFGLTQVGAIYNLSGDQAVLDKEALNGAKLAAASHPELQLIVKNGHTDPTRIQKIAKQFAQDPKIKLITGLSDNDSVEAAATGLDKTSKIIFSTGATSPGLVMQFPSTVYLTAFSDNQQAAAAAQFAVKKLRRFNAVILYDKDMQYTRSLASYFAIAYVHDGGTVTKTISFNQNKFPIDIAEKISRDNPGLIYLAASPSEVANIIALLRTNNVNADIVGGDSYTFSDIAALGDAANNVFYTTHVFVNSLNQNKHVQEFLHLYYKHYHQFPQNSFAALGYDNINLSALLLKNHMDFNQIKNYVGVTGVYNYSNNQHIPLKTVSIVGFHDNVPALEAQFSPEFVPDPVKFSVQ